MSDVPDKRYFRGKKIELKVHLMSFILVSDAGSTFEVININWL